MNDMDFIGFQPEGNLEARVLRRFVHLSAITPGLFARDGYLIRTSEGSYESRIEFRTAWGDLVVTSGGTAAQAVADRLFLQLANQVLDLRDRVFGTEDDGTGLTLEDTLQNRAAC